LYMPVVTTQGVAYSYAALFEMFMESGGLPICKETKERITFFPAVCLPLHHYLLEEFAGPMKGRAKQDDATLSQKYGFQMPNVPDAPDQPGDLGLLEELECVVSGEIAYEPCVLSSGSIVSASCVPEGGFRRDPNRLVACALHGQAPKKSRAVEAVLQARFSQEYNERGMELARKGIEASGKYASGGCVRFPAEWHSFWGLGCDGCGVWPIRGSAWQDAECKDAAGFHLCGPCYDLGFHKRVLSGRFNQSRLPKNRMERVAETECF